MRAGKKSAGMIVSLWFRFRPRILFLAISLILLFSIFAYNKETRSVDTFRALPVSKQATMLRAIAAQEGIKRVRAFLLTAYPDAPASHHELSHTIGELLFSQYDFGAFGRCDSRFSFGCYHGVIFAAIRKYGKQEDMLPNLLKGCATVKSAYFACIHGLGHAVMALESYRLISAYETCDKLSQDDRERFWCYDGVSMENLVRSVSTEESPKFLPKEKNIYAPCDELSEKYQPACARESIHYVRSNFLKTNKEMIDYCLAFHFEETREQCFYGMGANLNGVLYEKPQEIISTCLQAGSYAPFCITNAATQYAVGHAIEIARSLCNSLPKPIDCLGKVSSVKEEEVNVM